MDVNKEETHMKKKKKLDPRGALTPTMSQPRSLKLLSHAAEEELPCLRRRYLLQASSVRLQASKRQGPQLLDFVHIANIHT